MQKWGPQYPCFVDSKQVLVFSVSHARLLVYCMRWLTATGVQANVLLFYEDAEA